MGQVIRIKPEGMEEYKRLHAATWPEVRAAISSCNIRNYSIYLMAAENLMFSYWEYAGDDFAADMSRMRTLPRTQEWAGSACRSWNPCRAGSPASTGRAWKKSSTSAEEPKERHSWHKNRPRRRN